MPIQNLFKIHLLQLVFFSDIQFRGILGNFTKQFSHQHRISVSSCSNSALYHLIFSCFHCILTTVPPDYIDRKTYIYRTTQAIKSSPCNVWSMCGPGNKGSTSSPNSSPWTALPVDHWVISNSLLASIT